MAKDDYDVIAYRVLVYLYACMKRKIVYDDVSFHEAVMKNVESDEYFRAVLHMMQEEGLICGLVFTKPWGHEYILAGDIQDAEITAAGIHYLKENSTMQRVGKVLHDAADIIGSLAAMLALR